MADIQINVDAGTQTRLLTVGKYCAENILVTASSGSKNLENDILDRSIAGTYKNTGLPTIGDYSFYKCENLEGAFFQNLKYIQTFAFSVCTGLKYFCSDVRGVAGSAFLNCTAIEAFIVTQESTIAQLYSGSVFNNSSIAAGTGYIYVPDDLVSQYKVATNWVTYADQIKGLSELPAEVQEWLDQMEAAA